VHLEKHRRARGYSAALEVEHRAVRRLQRTDPGAFAIVEASRLHDASWKVPGALDSGTVLAPFDLAAVHAATCAIVEDLQHMLAIVQGSPTRGRAGEADLLCGLVVEVALAGKHVTRQLPCEPAVGARAALRELQRPVPAGGDPFLRAQRLAEILGTLGRGIELARPLVASGTMLNLAGRSLAAAVSVVA
jgi:hypothetical protein